MKIILWLSVVFLSLPSAFASSSYQYLESIEIGGQGGWDYVSVDSIGRRLYLPQATRVVVIDIDRNKVVGEIGSTLGVHGFAIAPELNRGYSSNGKENTVSVVDLKTLKTLEKIPVGEGPDAILYEPGQREVYTFNGRGNSATIISADTSKVIGTLPLPGKPEFVAADPQAHRVYVDIEHKNEVVAIDTLTHQIKAQWPVSPGDEPGALTFDPEHHRLFVGCGNQKLIVLDSESGKIVSTYAIGKGVDATAFDRQLGLVYSSEREGTTTIAHEDSPSLFKVVQTLKTKKGARTMGLDLKSHRIYLPTAEFGPPPAGQKWPSIVPGTLKVLVYSYGDR